GEMAKTISPFLEPYASNCHDVIGRFAPSSRRSLALVEDAGSRHSLSSVVFNQLQAGQSTKYVLQENISS
ncbi:hypothetical protein, partial [Mesorhizobium sp. M7A.F.Ca.CA.002.12.1.1]|uniref:hypothetical protein n=1 Tax=Mesorhizobium sp. M7A.F.Ca.CA.002.12.1.1 TaxID=2496735 RepID=UPI0019CFB8C4